jgi:LysM repeat protein
MTISCNVTHVITTLALFACCGCSTLTVEDRSLLTGMKTDIRSLEEQITRVNGRMEAIEVIQIDLHAELDRQSDSSKAQTAQVSRRVTELDARIQQADSARVKDRADIVEHLSKKIEEVLNKNRTSGGNSGGLVYEHVVKKGESLSRIAAEYSVSVKAIVKENNLPNANTIRVGQTLYIPK